MHVFNYFIIVKGENLKSHEGNIMVTLKWIPKPHTEILILDEVLNLCDVLFELRHPCPLHLGNYVLLYQESIPIAIPEVMIAIKLAPTLILHSNCRGCIKVKYWPKIRMVIKYFA